MMPASPPPPTDCSRPFHAALVGSQTSNLIAGETTPAMRQISGTLNAAGPGPGPCAPGGVNVPLTVSAVVIFVSGSASFARSAHVAAETRVLNAAAATAAAVMAIVVLLMCWFPLESGHLTAAGAPRA